MQIIVPVDQWLALVIRMASGAVDKVSRCIAVRFVKKRGSCL